MVEDYFANLGMAIERTWSDDHGDEDGFPAIASRALADHDPPPEMDERALLRHTAGVGSLVHQEDPEAGFGQPPITLFRSRDFFIAALVWLDGTTTIHEHGFSGALRVLVGSSIHVRYAFSCTDRISRRLQFGDLRLDEAEVLGRGDVRPIHAGAEGAHSLFHLERPSVTIVVRTYSEPWATPQLNYYRPGMALDPFYRNRDLTRKLQALHAMREIAPEESVVCAKEFLSGTDSFGGLLMLDHWFKTGDRGERFSDLVDHFVARHGSIFEQLRPAYEERTRELSLLSRRSLLHDPRHRLFLALLLNLPDWSRQRAICRALFPEEEPTELIPTMLEELSSPALRGLSGVSIKTEEIAQVRRLLATCPDEQVLPELRRLSLKTRPSDVWHRLTG